MIHSRYLSALAIAALLGSTPVLAQNTATTKSAPAATKSSKPLCSSLGHPNAGKHASKETGKAKEHSSSPVHMDCIPDDQAATKAPTVSSTGRASGTSGTSKAPTAATGSASTNVTSNPSVTGSTTASNSSLSGSTADSTSTVAGSTSTFSPNIDLRGRSSLTIDNTTSTGDQSLTSTTSATTGNQSLSSSTDATTSGTAASGDTSTTAKKNKSK